MKVDLTGKTAIITGASRGIGLATAKAFAAAGANVTLTSRNAKSAEDAAHAIGDNTIGVAAHATDELKASQCVERTLKTFGSIDILVNNAGTNPAFGPLLDLDHARVAKTLDVNLWAPLLWTSLVFTAWMKDHGGSIINTASVGGLTPEPGIGMYNVSKAALIYLTKQLALEMGPTVRINSVAPGIVRTRLAEALWKGHERDVAQATALGRLGEPHDVAQSITFLASDAAAWITGETLVIDGGQHLGAAQSFQRTGITHA